MIVCPHCSARLPPNVRFCPHCGKKIDVEFEQIKGRLAEEKVKEDAVKRERESRKLLIIAFFVFIVGMTFYCTVPDIPELNYHHVWSPSVPQLQNADPEDWLLEERGELLLDIPSD